MSGPKPPKQRRNRKKKEIVLDPQAAREEAELRMKIQQSLQSQYVTRATVDGGGVASNAVMVHGKMGLCGHVGDQDGMGMSSSMGTNNHVGMFQQQQMKFQHSQEQYNGQLGQFNRQQSYGQVQSTENELNQYIDTAEMKAYEMKLQAKKIVLQQEMQMSENQWNDGPMQYSNENQIWQQGMERNKIEWCGLSRADLLRELRFEQERLLEAAAQKQMTMSRGISSVSDNNSLFDRGLNAKNDFVDVPGFNADLPSLCLSQQRWYERQQFEQRTTNPNTHLDGQFEQGNRNNNQSAFQDRQQECRYTNPSAFQNGKFECGYTNQSTHQNGQFQRRHTNPTASTVYEQNKSYVDLTMSPQAPMQQMRKQMVSPLNLNQIQIQPSYYEEPNLTHSPSIHVQEMMSQYQMHKQRNHQNILLQKDSAGPSYNHLRKSGESLSETAENVERQANLQSEVDDITVMESLGISDLQAWLAFKSSVGGESIGFHSVGNRSASFGSVMGASVVNAEEEPVTQGANEGGNGTPLRAITSDGSPPASDLNDGNKVGKPPYQDTPCSPSFRDPILDLAPIAEDSLEDEDQKISFCSSNARKNLSRDPLKASLTIEDLRPRREFERSIHHGLSQNSGMSFTIGDSIGELGELLNSNLSEGIVNSNFSPGLMTDSAGLSQSDFMMSIDSVTYSALMAANHSNSSMTMNRDLSELLEDESASHASTTSNAVDHASDKSAPLRLSGNSRASGSTKRSVSSLGGRRRRSADSRPSIMSEISEWSSSNPYGDDSVENAGENDNSTNEAFSKVHQKIEVDVTELDALSDSVDISLSMMSSMCLAEAEDTLMMSLQRSEGYVPRKGSTDQK